MVRYLGPGQKFSFPSEFGFSGSASKAEGVAYAKGGAVRKAAGGQVKQPSNPKGYDVGGPVGTLGAMGAPMARPMAQPMAAPMTQMGAGPGGQSPLISSVVNAVMKNKEASGMGKAKGGSVKSKKSGGKKKG